LEKKYEAEVASNGIMFILNFVKIGQLVKKLSEGHKWRQHCDLISPLPSFSLRK
jgi:hypothetical protein